MEIKLKTEEPLHLDNQDLLIIEGPLLAALGQVMPRSCYAFACAVPSMSQSSKSGSALHLQSQTSQHQEDVPLLKKKRSGEFW